MTGQMIPHGRPQWPRGFSPGVGACLRRALLVVLALAPGGASAQGVTSPYLQIVWRYRAGDLAGAMHAASELPTSGLRTRALRDLGPLVCEQAGNRDCDELREREPEVYRTKVAGLLRAAIPAAALLHLHTSMNLAGRGKRSDAEVHLALTGVLLDRLTAVEAALETGAAASLHEQHRRARLLVLLTLQRDLELTALDDALRDALRLFPGDPDLLLVNGWLEETRARPPFLVNRYNQSVRMQAGQQRGWMSDEQRFRLGRAAGLYADVLAKRPDEHEARVRLGRVQFLQGRLDDARKTLAAVDARAGKRSRYLTALFLAALHEQAGSARAARQAYQQAIEAWPTAQTPRVALGRLLSREGNRAAAAALIAALPAEPEALDLAADPWAWYYLGQAWRLDRDFFALLADLKK